MNSNQTNTTETQKIKQQVMDDIKRVKDDIAGIQRRLTPGQIIDDVIYQKRGGGSPAETYAYLKENPIGASFLALGTILLMEDSRHQSYEHLVRGQIGNAKDRVGLMKGKMQNALHEAKDKFGHKKTDAGSSLESSKESFQEGMETVKETTLEAKSKIRQGIDSAKETTQHAKDRLREVSTTVKEKGHEYYDVAKNLDPLTYFAIGAGLGTLTGASIPISDGERQLVDSKFEERITAFGKDLQDALNQSINILKNDVLGEVTDFKFDFFK